MRETFDVAGITTLSSVYPSAVAAGELVYVSGQVSFDDDGAVVHEGDVTAQTAQCISRLADVLVGVGSVLADVVQATVYLADAAYADDFNREWSHWFADIRPARATVVAQLLDSRLLVEISATAVRGSGGIR
ncbi:RidA family protein [Rhodococcus sp. KBW08]|jgi:2-iminobutanoate/2-iminopropanoate deaminase|uniref:RidA family protein n=1 Tax=Rhodococcus TaxID=1827 RepID=UPI000BB327F6|nr:MULTISPECIES: RidA family protein [Rhodococcus]NHP17078.1 RidA family protein [Rhodococcus sp. IC4_135]PBI90385.1 Enamine/imine deaminase [Rhodococcus erythropolis]RQO47052.1 RidA family protein [Rhodococcus sp. KBW08]